VSAAGPGSIPAQRRQPILPARREWSADPLVVEICGSPGAGKTTIRPVMEELLRERGFVPQSSEVAVDARIAASGTARLLARLHADPGLRRGRGRRYVVDVPWGVIAALVRPTLAWRAGAAILRDPVSWSHRLVLFHRFIVPMAHRQFLQGRLRPRDAVIFDEGPVHRVVNLFGWRHRRPPPSEVRAYARRLPPPDLLVLVRARSDTAAARLADRGLPQYLRRRRPDEVARFSRHADEALAIAMREIQARTTIIAVDNDGTIDDARASLAAQLDGLLPAGVRARSRATTFEPTVPINVPRPDRLISGWRAHRSGDADLSEVLEAYPLRVIGRPRPIGRGRSWNVVVETDVGRVLVKRYKASVVDEAIACEHSILAELARVEVAAPRLVRTRSGETIVHLGPERHAAFHHLAGYMAGHERLGWPGEPSRLARLGGETLAGLHAALHEFWPAALNPIGLGRDHRRLLPSAWHLGQLPRPGSAEAAGEAEIAIASGWIGERLLAAEEELVRSSPAVTVIHGDYGPYNLLIRPRAPLIPIDFELARPDWRLVDLATAVPRFAGSRLGFDDGRARAFLDGYIGEGGIDRAELRLLPRVAEYLSLRRLAVCWSRYARSRDPAQLGEARAQLALARGVAAGTHPLARAAEW